jgi:hypothetical protein
MHAGLHGLTVHAFEIYLGDFLVAGRAGGGDMPMIYARAWVTSLQNCMRSVAVRAACGIFALAHGLTVHAVEILLDRMCEGHLLPRKKINIAVTLGAGYGELLFRERRCGAGAVNRVHRAVAGLATGRIRIAGLRRSAVRAFRKFLHFLLVAFGAFRGRQFRRRSDLMHISVTGCASLFA